MAHLKMHGECVCGTKFTRHIKKPTRFEFTTMKYSCASCQSRFLIQCSVDKEAKSRRFIHHVDLIDLSEKAKRIVQQKLMEKRGA